VPITNLDEFNALQQKVLRGEDVSPSEIKDAVDWVRRFRKTELPARTAKGAPKGPPRDLDALTKELGL